MRPFIPKEYDLPDAYGLKIFYVNGRVDEFEIASHNVLKEFQNLEFVTKEDVWNWVPLTSILRVEFDKRFSKIVAVRAEMKPEMQLIQGQKELMS